MTPLHVLILLAFAGCGYWSAGVLVQVVAELIEQGRALRHQGRSYASSSARRSDADPAAAQDTDDLDEFIAEQSRNPRFAKAYAEAEARAAAQDDEALVSEALLAAFRPDALVPPT